MYVADIIDEAVEICGISKGARLYKKISRAIQVLSKKGNWDSLECFLDLNVQAGQIAILPREVETPIKVTINGHPTFSREKLYEFSLNGPGTDSRGLTGWQWVDQNRTPILVDLPSTGTTLVVRGDAADTGKKVRFYGLDNANREVSETITLNGADQQTAQAFAVMRRVRKDITTKAVTVQTPGGDAVANYYANETEPHYRKIKLSKKAAQIHMLFRRTTSAVTSDDDFIPLDSEMAVLAMLRSHENAANSQSGPSDESEKWEAKAFQYLKEDQAARSSAAEMSKTDEDQPAFNLNVNNRDSIIVADIMDDAAKIYGQVGQEKLFDRIGDALTTLNDKSLAWEGSEGYVDLNVGSEGIVTLPRYVHRPIAINMGDRHLQFRNKWFEFNLNGPGNKWPSIKHWDDGGNTVTINDPVGPFRLVAVNDLSADDESTVRVYGVGADGKILREPNPDISATKRWIEGITLTAYAANTLPDNSSPRIKRITRITREETNGYQQLIAYDDDNDPTIVGYYYPDETEPTYSRIRIPTTCSWIRMRYRKRDLRISSLTDPLHLKSRVAVVNMMRALKTQETDAGAAELWEKKAVDYMKDHESASTPAGTVSFQFDKHTDMADPMQGQY